MSAQRKFCEEIWHWFSVHKRALPWRDLEIADDTQRAYMILVSEIMLQQTQVSRVEVIFRRFLREFPTIHDLAKASNAQVIRSWRGMGYNSRALRLRDATKLIVGKALSEKIDNGKLTIDNYRSERKTKIDGKIINYQLSIINSSKAEVQFPRTMEALTAIPGIGPYTAAAIRNFAFHIPTPCLDTNIRRILHRAFVGPEKPDGTWDKDDEYLLKIAEKLLSVALNIAPQLTTADWHAALMDFGALVCTKRNPKWDVCPLTKKGLMKAACKVPDKAQVPSRDFPKKKEPGRLVGSVFIPNRIFRGRIVDVLRDHEKGLDLVSIGGHICLDWDEKIHREWLVSVLEKLCKDSLVRRTKAKYALAK